MDTSSFNKIESVSFELYTMGAAKRNALRAGFTKGVILACDILDLLSDGQEHTASDISTALGISYNDSGRILNSFKKSGIPFIKSGAGRGKPSIWQLPPC